MAKNFKYELETGSRKSPCPACGKKTFVQYVVVGTRDYVGDDFGRCDRENNCGYHRSPGADVALDFTPTPKPSLPPPTVILPDLAFIDQLRKCTPTHFHTFCFSKLGLTQDHLDQWLVGGWQSFTAFILSNDKGFINVKFVAYTPEGKRDKSENYDGEPKFIPHYLGKSYLKKKGIETDETRLKYWQDYYKFQRCFYGEHLWNPEKDTCLVESEKTAVIASFFFPDYNWLAAGGNNGMTFEQFELFYGYTGRIWNLVDNDIAGIKKSKTIEWLDSLAKMRDNPGEILSVNLCEGKPSGWDLADRIIFEEYRNPETFKTDLENALDCRQQVEIDPESGEINVSPRFKESEAPSEWSTRDRDQFDKCELFIREIESRKLDLTKSPKDREDIVNSLLKFGEQGKALWLRLCGVSGVFKPMLAEALWVNLEAEGKAAKNPSAFFMMCKYYDITLTDIKNKKKEENKVDLPDGVDGEDYYRYGFYEKEGAYFSIGKDGPRCVAEFTIRVLYLIKSKANPKRIVELKNKFGYTEIMDMPTDSFSSLGTFKKAVESVGPYVFEGNDTDLTRLKKKLFREEKESQEIYSLGYFKRGNFYSFANGIYAGAKWIPADEYGIVEHGDKNYFLPFDSKIYRDDDEEYVNEKKFRFIPAKKPVKAEYWMELVRDVYGDNGIIGVCFYLSSIFRDILFDIDSNFLMLFCFGQRQSGKSTFMNSFKYLFGEPQDSISLENPSSVIGITRTLARFYNTIVCLDEYKNSLDKKAIGLLKGVYDGMGRTTGKLSNDNQTRVTKPNSAAMVGGQEMPTIDNALFTRFIMLEFYAKGRNHGSFEKLKAIEKTELVHITLNFMKYRPNISELALEAYKQWREYYKQATHGLQMDDRMVHNATILTIPLFILQDHLDMPYTMEEVAQVILETIIKQHEKISKSTDANIFWNIFGALVRQGQVKEEIDYRFKDRKLLIRISNIYSFYAVQHRHETNNPGLAKESLIWYLENSDAFIGQDKQKFQTGQHEAGIPKHTTTTCLVFDYDKLPLDIMSELEVD